MLCAARRVRWQVVGELVRSALPQPDPQGSSARASPQKLARSDRRTFSGVVVAVRVGPSQAARRRTTSAGVQPRASASLGTAASRAS